MVEPTFKTRPICCRGLYVFSSLCSIWPQHLFEFKTIYSWRLNSVGFNCLHPLRCRFFSVVSTVVHDTWLVESADVKPWIQEGQLWSYMWILLGKWGQCLVSLTWALFRGQLYSHLSKLSPHSIITIFMPLSKNRFKLEKASYETKVILVHLSILCWKVTANI